MSELIFEKHDLSNGRWYTIEEESWKEYLKENKLPKKKPRPYFISSTSVEKFVLTKGPGFDKWLGNSFSYKNAMDYANERADIGNIIHELCKHLGLGGEIDFNEDWMSDGEMIPITREMVKYIMSFQAFWNDYQPEVIDSEIILMDLTENHEGYIHQWAGTADLPCILTSPKTEEKKRFLIDIKTGNEYQPQHRIQLISYKMLYDVLNEEPIEEIACLYLKSGWRKKSGYTLKIQKFDSDLWWHTFELWKAQKSTEPKFEMELPTEMKLIEEK